MAKNDSSGNIGRKGCCFIVESMTTVDERGQMVLPKEVREKANIKPKDKLAVITYFKGKDVCFITLIKAENLSNVIGNILGPFMK